MTHDQLPQIKVFQTRSVVHDIGDDEQTIKYVLDCLLACYTGDYGIMKPEDTEANNRELESGYGRIVARYKARYKLTEDIYIIIYFDADNLEDIDRTNTTIMYVSDY